MEPIRTATRAQNYSIMVQWTRERLIFVPCFKRFYIFVKFCWVLFFLAPAQFTNIDLNIPLTHQFQFRCIGWNRSAEILSFDMLEAALPEETESPLPAAYFIYTLCKLWYNHILLSNVYRCCNFSGPSDWSIMMVEAQLALAEASVPPAEPSVQGDHRNFKLSHQSYW
jgi:hypothetical protein